MAKFGPDFWEALRRVRAAGNRPAWSEPMAWVPLSAVESYRAVDRDSDVPAIGGSAETQDEVGRKERSLRKKGHKHAGYFIVDDNEGLMQQGEGHHRSAAQRRLKNAGVRGFDYQPMYLVRGNLSPSKSTHRGSLYLPSRVTMADKNARFGSLESPLAIEELSDSIEYDPKKPGSPDDRAILKALGDKESAKRALGAMAKAGKIFGPAAGMIGLAAGLSDPAEALGMTVDKTGGGLDTRTAKDKRAERAYYAKKQAAAEKRNPMAKYGKHGSARKKK